MISSFRLKFGRAPGLPATSVNPTAMTVFVGPNNSGKSRVLQEIEQYCRSGQQNTGMVILDQVSITGLPAADIPSAIATITVPPNPGELQQVGTVILGSRYGRMAVPVEALTASLANPSTNLQIVFQWYLNHKTVRLDGPSRISLINSQPAGDLQATGQSTLQVLFRKDTKRLEVRRIIFDAFAEYFVIDPTNLGHLRIRFSTRAPATRSEERGIDETAVQFHAKAQPIENLSDGVKAFTGIVTELIAGDPQVLLIDEPEAFLHPSLAAKLGKEISKAAVVSDKRVFVSTHSPNFVMGCIQSGAQTNIVRLTYRGGVPTARLLPSSEILELMRNPLLRSTGVLNGLFYEFVVVTEADTDRAFYQEINERLLEHKSEWGIPNCLFINAQNKQTIHSIIRPLRQLGIPAAGIVDVDIFKEGGTVLSNFLSAANVPEITRSSLGTSRAAIKNAMDQSGKKMKQDGGISILTGDSHAAAQDFIAQLAEYGLFVVAGGELESWLKPLGATGKGPEWLISMFEKIGEDPTRADYVKPATGDVWDFIYKIKLWLTKADRKGIPA